MSKDKDLPVIEIFGPTIQGEGPLAGQRSHFVRFGGCSYRCDWCDSEHAVEPKLVKQNRTMLSGHEIAEKLCRLSRAQWVTLTGGDPCMHGLEGLIGELNLCNFRVSIETQGAIWQDWLTFCDSVVVSPKLPSSNMFHKTDWEVLAKYSNTLRHRMVFKFVIFTAIDLDAAKAVSKRYPLHKVYLSAGTEWWDIRDAQASFGLRRPHADDMVIKARVTDKLHWLYEEVLKDPFWTHATVFPQLHVLAWGHKQGV